MRKSIYIIFILAAAIAMVIPSIAFASGPKERTVELWGHVKDSFTRCGIRNVRISLMTTDSMLVDTMTVHYFNENKSYMDSYYCFNVPAVARKYVIKAECSGYEDSYIDFEIKYIGRNTYFDAPWHYMKRIKEKKEKERILLDEVVVKATRIKMVNRGDTVIYNADAFNLPEGSMLDALVSQMPGVKLTKEGEIFMNGRKVDYLLLDGKKFFKDDNNIMLDNLAAYLVKNIKFYEKETDKSKALGINVDSKDFVMDVNLKRVYAKGYLANADVGYGTNERYTGRAFATRITAQSRFTLFGNTNNINEYLNPGRDGEWRAANMGSGTMKSKTLGIGVNVDDKYERFSNEFTGNSSWRDIGQTTKTMQQNFTDNGGHFNVTKSYGISDGIFANITDHFTLKKPFYLYAYCFFNYINSSLEQDNLAAIFSDSPEKWGNAYEILESLFSSTSKIIDENSLVNDVQLKKAGAGHSMRLGSDISFAYRLPWGDVLELKTSGVTLNGHNTGNEYYRLHYNSDSINDVRKKYKKDYTDGYDYRFGGKYSMHFINNWHVELSYEYSQNRRLADNFLYRLDRLGECYLNSDFSLLPSTKTELLSSLDADNSCTTDMMKRSSRGVMRSYYELKNDDKYMRMELNLPITMLNNRLNYMQEAKDTILYQKAWLFQPVLSFDYHTDQNRVRYFGQYSLSVSPVDMMSLVNLRHDEDPLKVTLGNPNLKNTVYNKFLFTFSKRFHSKQRFVNVNTNLTLVSNGIAYGLTYDKNTGVSTNRPENINGNWNSSVGINYGSAIDKNYHWDYEASARFNFNRNVDLISTDVITTPARSVVNNRKIGGDVKLNYRYNKLSLSLLGQIENNNARNMQNYVPDLNVYNFSYGIIGNYTLPLNIVANSTIKMYSRRGYESREMNTNNLIWNFSLSRSFIKGRLTAKLEGFDVLHQLSNYSYVINGQGMTETITNAIPHYVLLHLMYKINIHPR